MMIAEDPRVGGGVDGGGGGGGGSGGGGGLEERWDGDSSFVAALACEITVSRL